MFDVLRADQRGGQTYHLVRTLLSWWQVVNPDNMSLNTALLTVFPRAIVAKSSSSHKWHSLVFATVAVANPLGLLEPRKWGERLEDNDRFLARLLLPIQERIGEAS